MLFEYQNLRQSQSAVMVSIPKPQVERDDFGNISKIIRSWLIMGEITGSSQAEIAASIRQLETAYNRDGGDAILYWPDGTISPHVMRSRDTLGGVRTSCVFYPDGDGVELVNGRKWQLELSAEFGPSNGNTQNQTQSFAETLAIQGDGGPRYVLRETRNTRPVRQLVSKFTPVRATQSGTATGYGSYPAVPPPIWGAPILQNAETAITRQSPQQTGSGGFASQTTYTVSWNYQFLSDGPLSGYPSKRTR